MYELYELRDFTESRGTIILKLYMYFQVLRCVHVHVGTYHCTAVHIPVLESTQVRLRTQNLAVLQYLVLNSTSSTCTNVHLI